MLQRKREEVTDVIRYHWNLVAATFDRDLTHGLHSEEQHKAWLELLARLAGPKPLRVLDVGCGTGFLALLFAELGHAVTGVDLAPQMVALAREKAEQAKIPANFRVGNTALLDDSSQTYDLVVGRHIIWTLPDPAQHVAEWLRVLRPGGRLALFEYAYDNSPKPKRPRSVLSTLQEARDFILMVASLCLGKEPWRLYGRKYWHVVQSDLPFSTGPDPERLVQFLSTHGMSDVAVDPLMNPQLWGEAPPIPRYLAVGTRPGV